jgi:hypothetical protein
VTLIVPSSGKPVFTSGVLKFRNDKPHSKTDTKSRQLCRAALDWTGEGARPHMDIAKHTQKPPAFR